MHRSLGVEYSFIQSTTLDEWNDVNVQNMREKISSVVQNETYLEYCVPVDVLKPNAKTDRAMKEQYIRMKYVDKAFVPSDVNMSPQAPVVQPMDETKAVVRSVGEIDFSGILIVKLIRCFNLRNADVIGTIVNSNV